MKEWKKFILTISSIIVVYISLIPWYSTIKFQTNSFPVGGVQKVTFSRVLNVTYECFSFTGIDRDNGILFGSLKLVVLIISIYSVILSNVKILNQYTKGSSTVSAQKIFLYLESIILLGITVPLVISVINFPFDQSVYNNRYIIFPIILSKIIVAYSLNDFFSHIQFHDFKILKISNIKVKLNCIDLFKVLTIVTILLLQVSYISTTYHSEFQYNQISYFIENNSQDYMPIYIEPFFYRDVFLYYLNSSWQSYVKPTYYTNASFIKYLGNINFHKGWYLSVDNNTTSLLFLWLMHNSFIDSSFTYVNIADTTIYRLYNASNEVM